MFQLAIAFVTAEAIVSFRSVSTAEEDRREVESLILNAVLPDQTRAETLNVRQPMRNTRSISSGKTIEFFHAVR